MKKMMCPDCHGIQAVQAAVLVFELELDKHEEKRGI